MIRIILFCFFSTSLFGQVQKDTLNCISYNFQVSNNFEYKQTFHCPSIGDTLLSVVNIQNSDVIIYLNNYLSYHVIDLFILDNKSRVYPNQLTKYNYLEFLYLWYPKVRKINSAFLGNLSKLKVLQFKSNLKTIPEELFQLDSLEQLSLVIRRNCKILIPADFSNKLFSLMTNVKVNEINSSEIIKLKLTDLTLLDVKNINENFKLFINIKNIRVSGKLNQREIELLKKYLPQAIYQS